MLTWSKIDFVDWANKEPADEEQQNFALSKSEV